MHIKQDLFSAHLEQTCSYSPLLKPSLRLALCNQFSLWRRKLCITFLSGCDQVRTSLDSEKKSKVSK